MIATLPGLAARQERGAGAENALIPNAWLWATWCSSSARTVSSLAAGAGGLDDATRRELCKLRQSRYFILRPQAR
jgi:hypothetical protein